MNRQEKWFMIIFMVVVVFCLDCLLISGLNNHFDKKAAVYRTALKTTDKDRFNYIIDSRQGNVITSTKLETVQPVKFNEMKSDGKFLAVEKTLEEYTPHTQTTTDSKGNTTTTTYWTWDDQWTKTRYSDQIKMYGRKYKLSKFNVDDYFDHIDANRIVNGDNGLSGYYHYLNGGQRIRYEVIPTTIHGTFIANTDSGTLKPIKDCKKIRISQEQYQNYLKEHESNHHSEIITAAVVIVILELGGLIYVWTAFDNSDMW